MLMPGILAFLIFACVIPFILVVVHVFTPMTICRRLLILLHLLTWIYELFFLIVVCNFVPHLSVHFGGGLGDLAFFFLLAGLILVHIILLSVLVYKTSRTFWLLIPLAAVCFLMIIMHESAARGNEENGYMTGGNCTGLYYDAEANHERWQQQKAKEEAEKAKLPQTTLFDSYLQRAEQGDVWAQNEVARCYGVGDDVAQNDTLAVEWCRKAAESGYAESQRILGVCYYTGNKAVAIDYAEAVKWFRKAAAQGHDDAQYLLGLCYASGKGVEKNNEEAFKWFRLAARQGHEEAQQRLKAEGQN